MFMKQSLHVCLSFPPTRSHLSRLDTTDPEQSVVKTERVWSERELRSSRQGGGGILGGTPASPLLFTALGSCVIGAGILSTPCSTSPLPDPYQPLHFSCSSTDLPLVIMPEPKQEVSTGWPRHKSAPCGQGDLGMAVTVTMCCRTLPPWPWDTS